MKISDAVIFVDQLGVEHNALLTAVHGTTDQFDPSVNLLYVSGNTTESDQYGRQINRESSVVHTSSQGAHGNYWRP